MSQQTYTTTVEVSAVDIPSMERMPIDEYRDYLETLMVVDHHDVLRSGPAGYPIATSRQQLLALLDHLNALAGRLR